MHIFDSHTHLNAEEFNDDLVETIARAKDLAVTHMAVVGFDYPTIKKSLELSRTYEKIWSIIGWHPTEAGSYNAEVEKYLYDHLTDDKVVALGEIGLDYYWMEDPKDVQEKIFRRQIAIAKEFHLPISIHMRDAIADTYRVLKEEDVRDIGGIMHSFNGDTEYMKRFLDLGMHISLSGVVTFKNAPEVQEVAKVVPLDKLLVETDAPYLAPVPKRGKRNEPGFTRYTVEHIAHLREQSTEDIALATFTNAKKLFRLEDYEC